MSLLEDVFLGDEAGEAAELERIVEGDEFDERPQSPQNSDDNSEKEDEAEEDKRRVDPTSGTKAKREIKNPRFVLNPARLTGPRGIQVIPEHFKDFKFKGKGQEKEDLDMVLKKLEHWAYRLYPKFQFEDCLKKIETLGKKRPVMVHLHKIRSDQLVTDEAVVQHDSDDEPAPQAPQEEDEFDKLLQQQIELARSTPASVRKPGMQTPGDYRSPLNLPSMAPKATSSPSISDEQRERMILNRRLAEERRLAKLNANSGINQNDDADKNGHTTTEVTIHHESSRSEKGTTFDTLKAQTDETEDIINVDHDIEDDDTNASKFKKNRSRVIDSSDSEDDYERTTINHVTVDVHKVGSQVNEAEDIVSETATVDLTEITAGNMADRNKKGFKATKERLSDNVSESEIPTIDLVGNPANACLKRKSTDDVVNADIPIIDLAGINPESNNLTNMSNENTVIDICEIPTVDLVCTDSVKLNIDANEVIDVELHENIIKTPKDKTIDLSDTAPVNKKNKPNVIESSDEECVDISEDIRDVPKDMHGSINIDSEITSNLETDNNKTELKERYESSDKETHNAQSINVEGNIKDKSALKDTNDTRLDKEYKEKQTNDIQSDNKHENFVKVSKNKENIDANSNAPEIVDDIMDVDFSDDF